MSANALPFHCDEHRVFNHACIPCAKAKIAYWEERIGKKPEPVLVNPSTSLTDFLNEAPPDERKPMATAVTKTRPQKDTPAAVARLSDPPSSHLAAVRIPTKSLWERMMIIRNLVLTNPGQCIRWYVNVLAEKIPAPELDAPGCRDSGGRPKHDAGFYCVWAPRFAQAENHGLIVKVKEPLAPTNKQMRKSPYPGESMVHVYEACTAATMQRMESERRAYFERVEAQKAADREAKATAVAQRQATKKGANSVREEIEDRIGTDAGQSDSWFQMI